MLWIIASGVLLAIAACAAGVRFRLRNDPDNRHYATWVVVGAGVVWSVFTMFMVFGSVPTGHVGIVSFGGQVNLDVTKPEGIYAVLPWQSVKPVSIQRQEVKRGKQEQSAGLQSAAIVSKDEVLLEVDVTFAYVVNPRYAPHLYRHVGEAAQQKALVESAVSSSIRKVFASFNAKDAYASQAKRREIEELLLAELRAAVVEQIRPFESFSALDQAELEQVVQILPALLENVKPPQRVLTAMAESKASEIDLERQKTLNLIAKQEADRRETEGTGVSKFLNGVPKDIPPDQAVRLLYAIAATEKARAITQAVQDGKISMIYLADAGSEVQVPAMPGAPRK